MLARSGASPQEVLQSARHILFVEGSPQGLDVTVLHELLTPKVRVQPLGASFSVRSVATALHKFHPEYWFVVDRDDWDDQTVETSWQKFPDPAMDNLLIWRRKELESYFLDPTWVCNSQYFKPGKRGQEQELECWLATEANKVLWLEAANRVLISRRNQIKRVPGNLLAYGDVSNCSREQVVEKLVASPLLKTLVTTVTGSLAEQQIRNAFSEEVEQLSGSTLPLSWGEGRWRDLMSGKRLFHDMINRWFAVPDLAKEGGHDRLVGRDAERAVTADLLRNHRNRLPRDFYELKKMMDQLTQP